MLEQFSIEALRLIDDGRPAAMVDVALEEIVRDCVDRPTESKERTLTIKLAFTPEPDGTGICDRISSDVEVRHRLPAQRSRPVQLVPKPSGALLFNPHSPDEPAQRAIDEVIPPAPQGGDS